MNGKLKCLSKAQQADIARLFSDHTLNQIKERLAGQGIYTSTAALIEFYSWYQFQFVQLPPPSPAPAAPAPIPAKAPETPPKLKKARVGLVIGSRPPVPRYLPATRSELLRHLEACRRHAILAHIEDLQASGISEARACRILRVDGVTVWRYKRAWLKGGFKALAPKTDRSGRRPVQVKLRNHHRKAPRCTEVRVSVMQTSRGLKLGSAKLHRLKKAA